MHRKRARRNHRDRLHLGRRVAGARGGRVLRVQGSAGNHRTGIVPCGREQGRPAPGRQPAQAHLHSAARRCHRALESHGPGLADAHGRTTEQEPLNAIATPLLWLGPNTEGRTGRCARCSGRRGTWRDLQVLLHADRMLPAGTPFPARSTRGIAAAPHRWWRLDARSTPNRHHRSRNAQIRAVGVPGYHRAVLTSWSVAPHDATLNRRRRRT